MNITDKTLAALIQFPSSHESADVRRALVELRERRAAQKRIDMLCESLRGKEHVREVDMSWLLGMLGMKTYEELTHDQH
jgi:hypothetical protein